MDDSLQTKVSEAAAKLKTIVDIQCFPQTGRITFSATRDQRIKTGIKSGIVLVALDIIATVLPWYYQLSFKEMLPLMIVLIGGTMALIVYWVSQTTRRVMVEIDSDKLMVEKTFCETKYFDLKDFRKMKVYSLSLNGRQSSPHTFFLKFYTSGEEKEVLIADFDAGKSNNNVESYKQMRDLWRAILMACHMELSEDPNDDVEFEIIARNGIFN